MSTFQIDLDLMRESEKTYKESVKLLEEYIRELDCSINRIGGEDYAGPDAWMLRTSMRWFTSKRVLKSKNTAQKMREKLVLSYEQGQLCKKKCYDFIFALAGGGIARTTESFTGVLYCDQEKISGLISTAYDARLLIGSMESTAETVKSMLSGLKKVPTDYDTYANNMINACRKAEQCLQEHTKELTEYAGFVEEMDDEMQTRFRECIMKGYESLLDSRFLDQKDLFESYIDNLRTADLGYSEEKLVSLECVARKLYGLGYETEFIAGVLGNIVSEANAGQFENSNYKSCPDKKPDYLEHMDNTYGYRTAFSNQNIQQKGIEATEELLTDIKNDPNAMFGLGCVQWTGTRTMELIECYKEICGENKFPSMEQCCQAEALMIRKELSSDGEYGNVYQDWKNNCSNNDFIESVRQASKIVCDDYEKPYLFSRHTHLLRMT